MGKILLVDDEQAIVETFSIFLSRAGHDTTTALSYDAAVQHLEREDFDVIICDIILGTCSGLDLLQQVKDERRATVFIVITGQPSIETTIQSIRAGAYDYLSKPVRKSELLRLADRAMEHKRLIARQMHLEQELQFSEERYRTIFENSHDGIALFELSPGAPCVLLDCNQAFAAMAGRSKDEILLLGEVDPLRDFEPNGMSAEELEEQLLAGHSVTATYSWNRDDGQVNYVHMRAVPRTSNDKTMVFTIDRDITQDRINRRALEESESRLQYLVQNMPVLIHAHDADGSYVFWNRESERVTGYSEEEIVNNPKAFELLYPSEELRRVSYDSVHESFDDHTPLEKMLIAADGTPRRILWSRISKNFPIPNWASWEVGVDITERTHAEEELKRTVSMLQAVLEALPGMVNVVAPDFTIMDMSKRLTEMHGFADKSEAIGRKCYEAYRGNHTPCPECIIPATLETCSAQSRLGSPHDKPSSGVFRKIFSAPMRNPEGDVFGVVECAMDFTDVVQAERSLAQQDANLQALIDASEQFLTLYDTDGVVLAASTATASYFGHTPKTLRGKKISELMGEGYEEQRLKRLDEVQRTKQPIDFTIETPTGRMHMTVTPLLNEHGEVDRLIARARELQD